MPLSLLVHMLTDGKASTSEEDVTAQLATADALTLRRLAVLSIIERWEQVSSQAELLDLIIKRDDPSQLGIFLASSHLNKQLSRTGALGRALCVTAEEGRLHATSILACRTSELERNRAAIRAAGAGQFATLDCLLRTCTSEAEEINMLRGCLVAAVGSGVRRLISGIVNALVCSKQTRIPILAPIMAISRGFEDVCKTLLSEFTWTNAERACLAELGASSTESKVTDHVILENVEEDDASSIVQSTRTFTVEDLRNAVNGNRVSIITAMLEKGSWSAADLRNCTSAAAEAGHFGALSRLVAACRQEKCMNEGEIQTMLGQALIAGSKNGHAAFVGSVVRYVKISAYRQRALHGACLFGQVETVTVLIRSDPISDVRLLQEVALVSAAGGHLEILSLLRQAHPAQEAVFEEVARVGLHRAARTGDVKLTEASLSLLAPGSSGGSVTAAVILAKRLGHEDVLIALKPLKRGISQFTGVQLDLVSLNDDVLDRVLSFLDLVSLARSNQLCQRFAARGRITEQYSRSLLADYARQRKSSGPVDPAQVPGELTRIAVVLSSASAQPRAFDRESKAKSKALAIILHQALEEEWEDAPSICAAFLQRSVDADLAPVTETLLHLKDKSGSFVIQPDTVRKVFTAAVRKQRHKTLAVLCRIALPARRLTTRLLVEVSRVEATDGNAGTLFVMMAALSREALASRRERDALWARRRVEWERRGGNWGALQQEEERANARTEEERDWDDAVGGALRRAASADHRDIVASILKMLRARGRLRDFVADAEKAFEEACRSGADGVVTELLSNVDLPEHQLLEGLSVAARNGKVNIARSVVLDGRVPIANVRSRFMDAARRGHLQAIQVLLGTGAIGAVTCQDALEEVIRRDKPECREVLEKAHARLVEFENEEEGLQ